MGKRRNTLEKCSASADVEATTEPSKNVEKESDAYPKKQKMQSEVDGTSDLQKTSDREEKTSLKKESDADEEKESDEDEKTALKKEIVEMTNSLKEKEKKEEHGCCFETEGAFKNYERTIFVSGFDCSLSRDNTRKILRKHFSPYGPISSVFVTMECKTGALLGFAFINLKEYEQALKLDGSLMGLCKLHVVMAKTREEYSYFKNFGGCLRCTYALNKRRRDDWIETCGGRCSYPLVP